MSAPVVQTGVYYIQNAGTGTVLDLNNTSSADNTKVQGYEMHDLGNSAAPAQLWIITQVCDKPVYTIQNAGGHTFLDIPNNNAASGTPIVGFHETGNASQRWVITRTTNKTAYVIKNEVTGTYIDLFNDGAANGTAVNGWNGDGKGADTKNPTQLWHIVRA